MTFNGTTALSNSCYSFHNVVAQSCDFQLNYCFHNAGLLLVYFDDSNYELTLHHEHFSDFHPSCRP